MKVQLTWLGKASGRSQNTIYQSYWGKTFTRSMPFLFHYPDTEKQQICQSLFFDIQRIWLPIYNEINKNIAPMQRRNKNPFNDLTSKIYHIFNPYERRRFQRLPKNFGLDKLNRVRPIIVVESFNIAPDKISFYFDNNRPYIGIDMIAKNLEILLFNITKQTMYYVQDDFVAGSHRLGIVNSNDWQPGDEIAIYVAISGEFWLGNFNLVQQ